MFGFFTARELYGERENKSRGESENGLSVYK